MVVCRGFGPRFHGQEVLAGVFSLFAGVFEKYFFLVLGPLVGPLCTGNLPAFIIANKYGITPLEVKLREI